MPFTYKDVAEILKLIDASQCEEVLIELKGLRLIVRRGRPDSAASTGAPPDAQPAPAHGQATGQALASPRFARSEVELTVADGRVAVRAPMVGTFYRRASPQEPPLVEIGQRVKPGDPLCVIEVMKLYTTITAPAAGTLEAVAVEDAAPVQFDQLLFVINPEASACPSASAGQAR